MQVFSQPEQMVEVEEEALDVVRQHEEVDALDNEITDENELSQVEVDDDIVLHDETHLV